MRKILAPVAISLGAFSMVALPAQAASDYSGDVPDGAVASQTVTVGERQQFFADCFAPGTTANALVTGGAASLSVNSGSVGEDNYAEGTVDAEGAIVVDIMPNTPGDYTITADGTRTCASGPAVAGFTVVDPTSGGSAGQAGGADDDMDDDDADVAAGQDGGSRLADTGSDGMATTAAIGLGLLGVGGAAMVAARRRASAKS